LHWLPEISLSQINMKKFRLQVPCKKRRLTIIHFQTSIIHPSDLDSANPSRTTQQSTLSSSSQLPPRKRQPACTSTSMHKCVTIVQNT
jgi:hypothetical protein